MKQAFAQESMLEPIIVDNFAGGGGASTGIELATGRIVNIAINHDAAAILMHRTNHPHTEHLQASVWDVDPVEVCRGRPVGLAWFSPDCKHFSKAKGAALLNRYCGYSLADDEVLVIFIGGHWYYIADIGLRMLSPRELYRAMGFPEDYKIETDYLGNPYPKGEQVARCGNAVCPPMAAAVVRANWAQYAVWDIATMAELERRVAV